MGWAALLGVAGQTAIETNEMTKQSRFELYGLNS
jgi:hypothetical protein